MAFCGKCGAKLDDDAAFCPTCGASVNPAANGNAAPGAVPPQIVYVTVPTPPPQQPIAPKPRAPKEQTATLVMGILAIVFATLFLTSDIFLLVPIVGRIVALCGDVAPVLGIVFGAIALGQARKCKKNGIQNSKVKAGKVLGLIGLITGIVLVVVAIVVAIVGVILSAIYGAMVAAAIADFVRALPEEYSQYADELIQLLTLLLV